MTQTAASAELERLRPFVGAWETQGQLKNGQSAEFKANDSYEWLPGGHFLLHRFDADMPDGKVQGLEVIGYSRESDSYPMHSFDSAGNTSMMQARLEKETWTFVGESIRFSGKFSDDEHVFAGLWEARSGEHASWQPLMEVSLRKVERMPPKFR